MNGLNKELVLYVCGKGGSAAESERYRPLFPKSDVVGIDYQIGTPRATGREIRGAVDALKADYERIILIANSIGAYFCMCAEIDRLIAKAFFISPIVDMEKLILDMAARLNVTEEELRSKGVVQTNFGEDLSWEYLTEVRSFPLNWNAPTEIIYGSEDNLTSLATITEFAERRNARLTVAEGGEHWFHTEEQLRLLDNWIRKGLSEA